MKSAQAGSSLVMFGFGFSGSGKTFQLISPGNKDETGREIHLLAQCLEHIKNNQKVFGEVEKINLKVSELYPFVDGVVTKDVSIKGQDGEVYLKGTDKSYENIQYPVWNDDVGKYLVEFNSFNKDITRKRTNLMRITPTPNNPESSRSHIFYNFEIKYKGKNDFGRIVIVDMAGTENTIEIKKNFLDVKPQDKNITDKFSKNTTLNILKTDSGIINFVKTCKESDDSSSQEKKNIMDYCSDGQKDYIEVTSQFITDAKKFLPTSNTPNMKLLKKIFGINNDDPLKFIVRNTG